MSRDACRRPPKPKKRTVRGTIPDQGKGYVPDLHYSLFTQATGFGAPKRPCAKSKENHWGGHVCFPRSLESQLFSIGDVCTISEPDVFYRGLKCILREFLPFEQMWKVKLDMRTNVVKVEEKYLTLDKAAYTEPPDHAKEYELAEKLKLNLVNHKEDPWGVHVHFESWRISRVHGGKQFHRLGIQEGYTILQVNGLSVLERPEQMKELLMAGEECVILLAKTPLQIIHKKQMNDFKPLPAFECKRCGCTGHYEYGYLWDDDHEKKCFCDSCCDHGCDAMKLSRSKRRENRAQAAQRAIRKSKPKAEAGFKLQRGKCTTCGCTGFALQGNICDFEGVEVCHCRKCEKSGCVIEMD